MKDETFWERVVEAFKTARLQEIADKVGISYAAVRKWKLGELPSITTITEVGRLTNSSIHWLITGKGPRAESQLVASGTVDKLQVIRVYLTEKLSELMEEEGSEEVIRYLIGELSRLTGHHEGQERKANARRQKQ